MTRVTNEELQHVLDGFEPVDPRLLADRTLLRRADSKFVLRDDDLLTLLPKLRPHYKLLSANGEALARYETLYFDTDDLRCFHDHRRGYRPRYKVRIRHYKDRGLKFLEVKTKRSDYLTDKQRKPIDDTTGLSAEDMQFIAECCDVPTEALREQLWTNFRRITLVGAETTERITIDTGMELLDGEHAEQLSGVVIMEVKQAPFSARTPAMLALRDAGKRRVSASKYCTANILLRGNLRCNRLLPSLRLIEGLRT